jgi:hypothetical protein
MNLASGCMVSVGGTLFTITYKVVVYTLHAAQRVDTLTLFHLYPYVLCGLPCLPYIHFID